MYINCHLLDNKNEIEEFLRKYGITFRIHGLDKYTSKNIIINEVFDNVVSCHFNCLENIWNFGP